MNTNLGGKFVSRLNLNLREDKHWSYGSRSGFIEARGPRPLIVTAPVQTDKTKESVAEVLKELRGIKGDKPVTADELQFAQSTLTLSLPGRYETAGAVAGSLGEMVRFGLDDRYFESYPGRVRALTLKDVSTAAQVLDPEHMVWVIVGDRAKIEAGVRELNLGEVRLIDADGKPLQASGASAGP
jgi:zinc protease